MNRAFVLCLACAAASAARLHAANRILYIQWSAKRQKQTRDWSGRARISQGRIVAVKKDSGPMDKVNPDGSWSIVYGRAFRGNPNATVRDKGLWLTVDAPMTALVTVTTRSGEFSFRLNEIGKAGLSRLGGDVRISWAKSTRRRRGRRRRRLPPAKVLGEFPAQVASDPKRQSDWPALARAADGTLWLAYVEWDGRARDRVLLRRRPKGGAWSAPIELDDGGWDHYWPAVAAVGSDALVVWSSQVNGNVELFWCLVSAAGEPGPARRLTAAPHTDFHARLAAGPAGDAALVWQSFRNGQSDVYARWFRGGAWGPAARVSPSPAHDWQPDAARGRGGEAWIVWDTYDSGDYNVMLRRLDPDGRLGPLVAVTTERTAQFHAAVAVDARDRVWIAWDEAGVNWGKDFSRSSAAPGSRGLHYSRTIRLRVFDRGRLFEPKAKVASIFTGAMKRYAELPRLAVDGSGALWLVFRHWTIFHPTEMYYEYAARLTDKGWVGPWRLARSAGRNTQWASLAVGPDGGLRAAYAADERSPKNLPRDQVHSLINKAFVAALPRGEGPPRVELTEAKLPAPGRAPRRPPRPTMTLAGQTYTLLLGDCHRHTDIRGHSGVDGSILDTYRYALDCVPLDYLGMGDHNEVYGGRWPDGLRDYSWWRTQKTADLFNCPPAFVAVYSYEHSMGSPAGHRNLIFLKRGAPLRMIDRKGGRNAPANQPPELWKWVRERVLSQPGQKCVIVPHTFASGPLADWNWPNPPFDCLLEIYQGCRGSYEAWGLPPGEKRGPTQTRKQGHFARDALGKGELYGFVSFSDHGSTHNSFGALWVKEASRAGVIEAMLARRTYAATDQIVLKVTADGHAPGEQFDASVTRPPVIRIDVAAPDKLLRADVIKDGAYVWTRRLDGTRLTAEFRDADPAPGRNYYYVRVLQRDPEKPDGDPEIAWASPFFVRYK